ncbi:MAG: GNAT family N-acetyltransferase [Proteobacteria bacterium]|nr:GNAT family N-acetyltransferase [Pseudomonadota bacterium]
MRELRLRALRDAPDAYSSTFEESSRRPLESWSTQIAAMATFIAVRDGRDVGLVRGATDGSDPDTAWLLSMWVAPDARGTGVGDALVDAVVGWARSACKSQILLEVADDNAPAIALYGRKGFEPNGRTVRLRT